MKQFLLKVLKFFLIILLILLAISLIFGLVLWIDWPWWVGLFILVGLGGLWVGLILIKKIMLRRREQHFVNQVINQDESYIQNLGADKKDSALELQQRWKEAMEALRKSHLKKLGNPLYVLPWYLVIGESGSGKTTAIKSARLSSPFAEVTRTSGISGTRNCDWWFFEQAILIDTAGRYAIPVDEGHDRDEWQKFLSQLIKFRKKEPINGLIVTVGADKLLSAGADVLEADGRKIRQRIDELMRVLGARFPVYLVVTKCDLVQGMTQFCDQLTEKSHEQAMGMTNLRMTGEIDTFAERVVQSIGEKLRDLRLLMLQKTKDRTARQGVDPGLLLFPEEFERLKPGLNAFSKGAFQKNPYQESPLLRGLFFSSGRQEGSPYSHFLNALGLIGTREVLPGTNKGLFLHDLFTKIFPRDRALFAPTQRTLEWGRLTRNLGLTSWVAVVLALCGLLSFTFVKNLQTIRTVSREFSKPALLSGELFNDVIIMDRFRQAVLKVEKQNKHWWIPRMGLNQSLHVENTMKEKYCRLFKDGFMLPLEEQMTQSITGFSDTTSEPVVVQYVDYLVKRINLIKAQLEGKGAEHLSSMGQPSYDAIAIKPGHTPIPELKEKFAGLHLHSLFWRQDPIILNREMNNLQTWLKHILIKKRSDLNWLVQWADSDPDLTGLALSDFWGGSLAQMEEPLIPAAYTTEGKQKIDAFLGEIESALSDPLIIAERKLEFRQWYLDAYLETWHFFAENFPRGKKRLQGLEEWQPVAASMAFNNSPYFVFFKKMRRDLLPLTDADKVPSWIDLVYEYGIAMDQAGKADPKDTVKIGIIQRAASKVKAKVARIEKKIDIKGGRQLTLKSQLTLVDALTRYRKALGAIAPAASSRRVAFQMAGQVFSEDPSVGESPFFTALSTIADMKAALQSVKPEDRIFWDLVTGPLDYYWDFVCKETACRLSTIWEQEVLIEIQGVTKKKVVNEILLGQDGFAVKFIKGAAAPFVGRTLKKGYFARKIEGRTIAFTDEFFNFFTKGVTAMTPVRVAKVETVPQVKPLKSNYFISIKGLPTNANADAVVQPHATQLELQCAEGSQKLTNLNYPVHRTFNWSPASCGDVTFQIKIEDLVLLRKYTGEKAFVNFLKDFAKGKKIFYPKNFPRQEKALKGLNIKSIRVSYGLGGHKQLLNTVYAIEDAERKKAAAAKKRKRGPKVPQVPQEITVCWDL
ncbi:MAG: type VI secretion system protein ImpL [Deltaproteobacteria bacterium]|nr:type VI secretion system protein ImpL [Deltaproteobacteria bacterium]